MARSHPPSLITIVRRTLLEECGPLRSRSVLAAVSGGGDSQAMLEVLARLAPKLGYELRAHGIDHGLRSEARRELELAEALARRLGVPFGRTRLALARGANLQARAREARYAALREAAAPDDALIATAHHADDRAETLLLRLLRGSGPRGLAVLPARAQGGRAGPGPRGKNETEVRPEHETDVIRPLLRATKQDVIAHLGRHRLDFAQDPSNSDAAFLRVRVRHELLPLLTDLSPQIVRHLNALADALEGTELPNLGELELEEEAPALNRAQIREVLRARRLGRSVTVRLPGGRDLQSKRPRKSQ
ncbi:MAG TPA: tRNA lysidine(34) synthetase TilS [Polyangiaceae bacterium]|nr:tRNA lysidine(34) synthetase TilS [Polyangiaceae bacterium]